MSKPSKPRKINLKLYNISNDLQESTEALYIRELSGFDLAVTREIAEKLQLKESYKRTGTIEDESIDADVTFLEPRVWVSTEDYPHSAGPCITVILPDNDLVIHDVILTGNGYRASLFTQSVIEECRDKK